MSIRKEVYYWKADRPFHVENTRQKDDAGAALLELQLQKYLVPHIGNDQFTLRAMGGQGNHITYLATSDAGSHFIRIENGPELDDYMDIESQVMLDVKNLDIPTPKIFHTDCTRKNIPFAIQVMEFVEYPDLNQLNKPGKLNLNNFAGSIGSYIAAWQQIKPRKFGLFDPEQQRIGNYLVGYHERYPDYFMLNLEKHLDYLIANGFLTKEIVADIKYLVLMHSELLDLTEGCLVHKDLALWNILGDEKNIKAFIDWDDTISGDPVDDLTLLACFHNGDVIQAAINGYSKVRTLPENFLQRFWLHLLRNMLFKAVIRIKGNYFQKQNDFFLMGSGHGSADLKTFTLNRIQLACEGLKGKKDIKDL